MKRIVKLTKKARASLILWVIEQLPWKPDAPKYDQLTQLRREQEAVLRGRKAATV